MDLTLIRTRDPSLLDYDRMTTIEKPSLNDVYHHGIKGMKWGVRRTPEQLGHDVPGKTNKALTAVSKQVDKLDKVRRKAAENYHKNELKEYSDRYQQLGMTKADADAQAEKDYQFRKKVAYGVLAVGAAAIVGTAVYAYGKNHTDEIIRAGTTLQTLSHDPQRLEKGRQFFTNFRESDKTSYVGLFGGKGSSPKHAITAEVQKDMRVASYASGKKAFKELMKNDPEFAKDVSVAFKGNGAHYRGYKGSWDKFNATVLPMTGAEGNHGKAAKRALDKYFDHLQSKGYSGVTDVNDTKYSTLRGRSPSIIFDKSNLGATSVRQLTRDEIANSRTKALRNITVRHLLEPGRTIPVSKRVVDTGKAALVSIGVVGAAQTVKARATVSKRKMATVVGSEQSKAKARYVAKYQREHPKSKLTYQQIEDLYEQEER